MKPLTTFSELEYVRPDFEALKAAYTDLNARVAAAKSYEEVKACMLEEEEVSSHVSTMAVIASICHTVDTSDGIRERKSVHRLPGKGIKY